MSRQVILTVDGTTKEITTHALTVRGALRSAGYRLTSMDKIQPPASSWLSQATEIVLIRAHDFQVWNDATGQLIPVDIAPSTPLELLMAAGIAPAQGDLVRINGLIVPLDFPLAEVGKAVVQYTPAQALVVNQDGQEHSFRSAASTLGQSLWDEEIYLHGGDSLSQSFTAAPAGGETITITSAVPLTITVDGQTLTSLVNAATIGEALAMAGVSLQDKDFSRPAETEVLPADGRIEVVRVREEILQETQSIPYSTETINDASLALGESSVVTAGEFGSQVARVSVRYENGVEVSRTTLDKVVLKNPVNEVKNVGTKVTAQNVSDTTCGAVQYYRSMAVTTTSYSPCNSDTSTGECSNLTALGTQVQQGVLAVSPSWFKILKGTQICIPGYGIGTVEDIGSYPNNPNWIDLGYTDAQLAAVPVSQWTHLNITVYFLSPKAAELGQ